MKQLLSLLNNILALRQKFIENIIFDGANSNFQGIRRHFSERRVDNSRFNGQYLKNFRGSPGSFQQI